MRYSTYNTPARSNEEPITVGDDRWVGYNSRLAPRILQASMLSAASNVRMRSGQPTTRGGTVRPGWAHRILSGAPREWGRWKAACNFRNPDNVSWLVLVDSAGVWRLHPNNPPLDVPLPAYAGLPAQVSLTQAFNKLFLFRGKSLRPLVCDDLDIGFRDVVAPWDITLAYDAGSLVAWGPWTTLSAGALTSSGVTATLVFAAAHSMVSGADLTIRGAVETAYNGRFKVTVTDETTVTFTLPAAASATPATGTIKTSPQTDHWENALATAVADEPGVTGWARNYTILPNGIEAAFLNNRLFVPTAYLPGSTDAVAGSSSAKADYVASTDVLDYRQFSFDSEFRINQGSADELLCVVKGSANSLVCFKGESVYLLSNVYGNLSNIRLEQLKDVYGIVNGRAVTTVGRDLVFVSPKRGVVALLQSETGELQGADVPLSDPIQPEIARIAWQYGSRIRITWWDNKLYVAVPLDDGRALGTNRIAREVSDVVSGDPTRSYLCLDIVNEPYALVVGQKYRWDPGTNTTEILSYKAVEYSAATEFTYGGEQIFLRWTGATGASSNLRPVYTGVNNAVLVYDYQLQAWQSVDSGVGICPEEFVVYRIHGRDRLVACMSDGTVAIYEDSVDGDVQLSGLLEDIETSVTTRGYAAGVDRWRGRRVNVSIGTWAASWSLDVLNEGVGEEQNLKADVTGDRTVFRRPVTAARFDPEAADADFDQAYREDYSEVYPAGLGFDTDSFLGDRLQVFDEQVRIPSTMGSVTQLRFSNVGGVATLLGVALELTQTERREGSKV